MPTGPVRFLHAGDFRLGRPVGGVLQVPDRLRDRLLDAPYQAVERVFQVALDERVDFVVLSGDLVDLAAGSPRSIEFLHAQFSRLLEKDIAIYWLSGELESGGCWPRELPLPGNVHVFPPDRIQEYAYRNEEQLRATISGRAATRFDQIPLHDHSGESDRSFRIAVAYGDLDLRTLGGNRCVDYWALGGEPSPEVVHPSARYCGSPQARSPAETGPRGAILVEVDQLQPHAHLVPTDLVRFMTERIEFNGASRRSELESAIAERQATLEQSEPERLLLVTWQIATDREAYHSLRLGEWGCELFTSLERAQGKLEEHIWTVGIECEMNQSDAPPEENTFLGDFLRTVQKFKEDPNLTLNLEPYRPQTPAVKDLADRLRVDGAHRQRVLPQVGALGVDLLSGP